MTAARWSPTSASRGSTEAGVERLTTGGMVVGTPSYMSPEQASAEVEVDARSDIYSLGCVLYEMLAGRPPFTGATPQAIVARHMTEAPPPLRDAGRRVRPSLERVVRKALAKAPGDRYTTAAEFGAALEHEAGASRRDSVARRGVPLAALALVAIVGVVAAPAAGAGRDRGAGRRHGRVGLQPPDGAAHHRRRAWRSGRPGRPTGPGWPTWRRSDGYRQLFVRTLATGEERRVTRGRARRHPARLVARRTAARVRPRDGRQRQARAGRPQRLVLRGRRHLDAWTWPRAGERRLVPNAFGPAWSPDGTRLAFDAAWAGPRRIWVSDSSGLNPRQLTSDSSEAVIHAGPRWSPDGRRLVFRRIEKTDVRSSLTADVASGALARVTQDAADGSRPGVVAGRAMDLLLIEPGRRHQRLAGRRSAPTAARRAGPSSSPPARATTSSPRPRRTGTGWRSRCAGSTPTSGSCRFPRRPARRPARRGRGR